MSKTRIKDIAEKAGVSPGTVDRVIHNRGEVSEETRKAVIKIIDEMQYSPNLLARRLASPKKLHIAVLIPEAAGDNEFWDDHLKGIRRAGIELSTFGLELEIYRFLMSDTVDFRKKGNELLASKPDCILIAPVFFTESMHFLGKCKRRKIPFAFIDTNIDNFDPVCSIGQNPCQSGAVAAKLLSLGGKPDGKYLILNITREKDQLSHLSERERGFRLYFENKGEAPEIISIDIHGDLLKSLKSELRKFKGQEHKINGIFVTGSKAHLVAHSLESLQMSKVRLVGYDLVEDNKKYLRKEVIDFLISQQPEDQGYMGIKSLFDYTFQKIQVPVVQSIPIDIITRENLEQYPRCH